MTVKRTLIAATTVLSLTGSCAAIESATGTPAATAATAQTSDGLHPLITSMKPIRTVIKTGEKVQHITVTFSDRTKSGARWAVACSNKLNANNADTSAYIVWRNAKGLEVKRGIFPMSSYPAGAKTTKCGTMLNIPEAADAKPAITLPGSDTIPLDQSATDAPDPALSQPPTDPTEARCWMPTILAKTWMSLARKSDGAPSDNAMPTAHEYATRVVPTILNSVRSGWKCPKR